MTVTRSRRIPVLTAIGAAAALVLALVACDSAEPHAVASGSTAPPGQQSSTTQKPAEQVAKDFLDAYSAFETDRALAYLTEDAVAEGAGDAGSWGSEESFRMDVAMTKAQHIEQMLTGCELQGESAEGTAVQCAFDLHAFHSEEIGRGPYSDNHWDIVVDDGKVTSAVATWAYMTNGFSAELWQPFQAWVATTHPEDLPAMYLGNSAAITEESIRLWDERTGEWAEEVKASTE